MPRANGTQAGSSTGVKFEEPDFDRDQDPEEKRDVRREYRKLQDLSAQDNTKAQDLHARVEKINELFDRVHAPGEAVVDSDVLLKLSMQSAKMARAMKSGTGAFDVDDFLTRLVTFMGGRAASTAGDEDEYDDEDGAALKWERIGWKALAKSRRVPAMDFMCGPITVEQKTRAVTKRAKLEKHKEDQRKPQEITEDDITRSANETTKNVANLERILETCDDEVNLFKFIINPNDFGQSVENLFYLSFLIRDGKCALNFDAGEPKIMLCQAPDAEDYANGLKKNQLVMEFDMATWRRAIDVFHIREPMIPQRPKAQTRIGNKWYG